MFEKKFIIFKKKAPFAGGVFFTLGVWRETQQKKEKTSLFKTLKRTF